MDTLTAIAASGLRARMESLDLLANNIANTSTGGYKADREFYSLYVAPEAADNDPASTMPLVERQWIDLSQGLVHPTGNPLDLALSGAGFFTVQGPNGPLYTRNGSFRLAPDGKLVTPDGYPVLGADGGALTLNAAGPVEISSDGSVRQNGNALGTIALADFADPNGLAKQGGSYFVADPAAKTAVPAKASVDQGELEDSNASAAEGAGRLVAVMRQFEMMQKAVSIGNDMAKQAIEQVARVGPQ
jgi:flagellar basal-body rod protein FlgF